jgi:two-component system, chemotaxis family, CheB/CheR fusion protein
LDVHREGQELVMSVEDNGIGIPEQLLPKIFELFTQEERTDRKSSSGLGIGLSLVFQLVSLHGGSVKASSPGPGKGSIFEVRLPLADPAIPASPPEAKAPEAGKERVLIVDDNIDGADSLAMLLAIFGYEARATYEFESAIREAVSFIPHVALLDLSKPQPNGLELAKRFQQMKETQSTVLIAFTGYGQPDDLARSRDAGFSHHLVKPVDAEAVHRLIKSMKLVDRQEL